MDSYLDLVERVGMLEVKQAVAENTLETLAEGFHEMSGAIKELAESINQGKGVLWTIVTILGSVDIVALILLFGK